MRIFKSLDDIKNIKETVVALGNFDGIHKGHQELIRRAVKSARVSGHKSAVFTFNNHPKNVIAGKRVIKNIMYWGRRMLRRLTAFAMLLCVIGAGVYLTMTMLFRINSIQAVSYTHLDVYKRQQEPFPPHLSGTAHCSEPRTGRAGRGFGYHF